MITRKIKSRFNRIQQISSMMAIVIFNRYRFYITLSDGSSQLFRKRRVSCGTTLILIKGGIFSHRSHMVDLPRLHSRSRQISRRPSNVTNVSPITLVLRAFTSKRQVATSASKPGSININCTIYLNPRVYVLFFRK